MVGFREYQEVKDHVGSGDLSTIEGTIVNVAWVCNMSSQRFVVSTLQFGSETCLPTPGFSPGSLLQPRVKNGMYARVTFFDSSWKERVITRFEVKAP